MSSENFSHVLDRLRSIDALKAFEVLDRVLDEYDPSTAEVCLLCYRLLTPAAKRRDTTEIEAAIHAAAVASFLIDDIMDQDEHKPDFGLDDGRRANLGGALLVAGYKLIGESSFPVAVKMQLANECSDLLLEASAGQEVEASLRDEDVANDDPEGNYWKVIHAKSSQQVGRNMKLGCIMAERSELEETLFELGVALGDMMQISDDIADALSKVPTPDWEGTGINLLILFCFHENNPRRDEFAKHFETALTDPKAHRECREIIIKSGAVGFALHHLLQRFLKAKQLLQSIKGYDIAPLFERIQRPIEQLAKALKLLGIRLPDEITAGLESGTNE